VADVAQADRPATTAAVPVPGTPAQASSAVDIHAALEHLVAAREALLPAEAALAIDHAEFGEISIRFEQSRDGQLSAEIAAADPEMQRAVTAAVATERGHAAASEGDHGRSAPTTQNRNSASAGDTSHGERGQPGADREQTQRRTAARSPAGEAAADQRPGVFA
jgi:hypothetical protein